MKLIYTFSPYCLFVPNARIGFMFAIAMGPCGLAIEQMLRQKRSIFGFRVIVQSRP